MYYIVKKPKLERVHLSQLGHIPANLSYKSESMAVKMLNNCDLFHNAYSAVKYTQSKITHEEKYDEFGENIELTAKMLKECDAKKGDRVIVLLPWLPENYQTIYATLAIGAILVPLHPNETKSHKRMAEILREIKPSIIICLDACVQDLDEIMLDNKDIDEAIKRIIWTKPVDSLKKKGFSSVINPIIDLKYSNSDVAPKSISTHSDKFIQFISAVKSAKHYNGEFMVNVSGQDDAVFLYSSGTSGKKPAAILHTHDAFNSLAVSGKYICDCIVPGQKVISVPGSFHGFGFGTAMHTLINYGVTQVVVPNPKDLDNLAETQRREKAEIHIGVPLLLTKMKNSGKFDDISYDNTVLFISGGAAASENTVKWWNDKLPSNAQLREGYGSSQVIGGTCINLKTKQKPNSIGVPLPDYYYKLVNTETEEIINKPNEVGEAYIAGPSVLKGILGDSNPDCLITDDDGVVWYKTSDLLKFDEDGWYYFVDRADDVLNMNNANLVNPHDIRQVFQKLGIEDAVIFKAVNETSGYEKIVAVVEYKADKEMADYLKWTLKKAFDLYLKDYEIPDEIVVLPTLPLSLNGKPLRNDVRKLYDTGEYQYKMEMKN